MKMHKAVFATILVLTLFLSAQPVFAGQAGSVSPASAQATTETVTQVNALESMVSQLIAQAKSDGCANFEDCRKRVQDILQTILDQAERIEAKIPELAKGFDSPAVTEKLDRLKTYVSKLRTTAQTAAQGIL